MEKFSILFHLRNGNFSSEIYHIILSYVCNYSYLDELNKLNKHICSLTFDTNEFDQVIRYYGKISESVFKLHIYYDSECGYSDDEDEDIMPISKAFILTFKKQKYYSHLIDKWYFGRGKSSFTLFKY